MFFFFLLQNSNYRIEWVPQQIVQLRATNIAYRTHHVNTMDSMIIIVH